MQISMHCTARVAAAAGLALTVAAPAALALNDVSDANWEPQRPIEFVIQTSPGGGSDILARLWIGIINELDISPVPWTPVNMPGGAGAVALSHLVSKKGDPHYLTVSLNSIVTTPLQQELPIMYPSIDLTPVAGMVVDPFVMWTNPDVITSWEDFKAQCQERELIVFGTGSRQEDQVQTNILQQALPQCMDFRFVPQAGGGDVASKIAGKHGDISFNQTAEGLPHYPENMIPILTFGKEPHPNFPEVPTVWELDGISDKHKRMLSISEGLHQVRGVMGPPCLPKEAVAWYGDIFQAVFESDRWQAFMEKAGMMKLFIGPEAYTKKTAAMETNYSGMLKTLGWPLREDLVPRSEHAADTQC